GKYEVAAYLILFGHLSENYLTKDEAEALGWEGGSVEKVAPGYCIGGDRYGNYDKALPNKKGRMYYECDIDTLDYKNRGSRRLIYSNDGLIYYSKDHYKTFELIWGEE
ncbi:MAG: ribonuclease, partial [Firmicutes bacterium]|nr:ribonuclease [Bacillota bacterium]